MDKLVKLENDDKEEKTFVKSTLHMILRQSEKNMKEMSEENEKSGMKANGEVNTSSDDETPPANGMVQNPFFQPGAEDKALKKDDEEKEDQWAAMMIRGAQAKLESQGLSRPRSSEFKDLIDRITQTRKFPDFVDFDQGIYENLYQSLETIQAALNKDTTAEAAIEWKPSSSNELEVSKQEGSSVCEKEDDAQQEDMVDEESAPEDKGWAKAIQVVDIRAIDMTEYNQLTEYGMTRQEARDIAREYQIKFEEARGIDMITEEVFEEEKELYKDCLLYTSPSPRDA